MKTIGRSLAQYRTQPKVEEDNWIFHGQLKRNSLMLLAGGAKVGKTCLYVDTIYYGLTGESNDLIKPSKPLKILLWASDESRGETEDKFRLRGIYDLPDEALSRLYWVQKEDDVRFHNIECVERILLEAQKQGEPFDYVIADCLGTMLVGTGVDENHPDSGNVYVNALHKFSTRFHVGTLLVHHTNKKKETYGADKISGHHSITTNLSGWMKLDSANVKDETCVERILSLGGCRGISAFQYKLTLNPDIEWLNTACFEYEGEVGTDTDSRKLADDILQLLQQHSGIPLSVNTIQSQVGGKYFTITKTLSRMVQKGTINRDKNTASPAKHHKRNWLFWEGYLLDNTLLYQEDNFNIGGEGVINKNSYNPYISVSPTTGQVSESCPVDKSCPDDGVEETTENQGFQQLDNPPPPLEVCPVDNAEDVSEDEDDDYKIEKPTEIGQMCTLHPRAANDLEDYIKEAMVLVGVDEEEENIGFFVTLGCYRRSKDKLNFDFPLKWYTNDFISINDPKDIEIAYSKAEQQRKNKSKKVLLGMSSDYKPPTDEPVRMKRRLT
ncbi:AAA family ATPase [Chroococcidiopsis sp. FACHB-1243]|uniref:AAA family ATPase n=1 Tax=Chroococcidiopsis sp. [FACHB-1243] TaxID=2692781 RepID=UPI001780EE79|nr:AAA family ATPase [Chroococcidiopsis sp. [FACHB-1243]]MBD2308869.1 AAA family ATPase [Chroococcidiopsis sp. [FACHB-1243]]